MLHCSTSLVIKFSDVRSLSSRPNVFSLVLRLCFLHFDLDFLLVVHIQSVLLSDVLLSDVLHYDVLLSDLDSSLSCELDDARPCKPLRLPPLGPVWIIFLEISQFKIFVDDTNITIFNLHFSEDSDLVCSITRPTLTL